ncbi:MAG TPA: hypothetical protein VGG82_05670 [Casimicrobiaceae bacterium]
MRALYGAHQRLLRLGTRLVQARKLTCDAGDVVLGHRLVEIATGSPLSRG